MNKKVFYELRECKPYSPANKDITSIEIYMVVKNKMGTFVYKEALGQKENWWRTNRAKSTLIHRDKSYEVLDAMRKLL